MVARVTLAEVDTVRTSGGGFGAVTDEEVVDGMRLLARTEGVFGETAAGVTVADDPSDDAPPPRCGITKRSPG